MLCLKTQRTLKAQAALQAGDLETFGRLMNASHVSLEHDYEVTGFGIGYSCSHSLGTRRSSRCSYDRGRFWRMCHCLGAKDAVEDFKEAVGNTTRK